MVSDLNVFFLSVFTVKRKLGAVSSMTPQNVLYNQVQNIFGKIKTSSKVGEDQKTLMSAFAQFLSSSVEVFFGGETGH